MFTKYTNQPSTADTNTTTLVSQKLVEELNEGKKLYEANCNSCHSLYHPSSQTEKGWQHEVPSMSKRVNRSAGFEILDEAKQALILRYLVTAANSETNK